MWVIRLKGIGRLTLCTLAALVMAGCGGSEEEDFPLLFPMYGGAGSLPPPLNLAKFNQEFTMSDGTAWTNICEGIIRVVGQEGGAWSGRAERGGSHGVRERCYSTGEIAGEVHMDGTIRFTLTQQRWPSMNLTVSSEEMIECSATGPGEYSGFLERNRFYAVGTTPVVCADGREGAVQETMRGEYPAPDGSHDT